MTRKDQKTPYFKKLVAIRVQLGRIESAMYLWAKEYEEITPRLLDQLLRAFQKTITLAGTAPLTGGWA